MIIYIFFNKFKNNFFIYNNKWRVFIIFLKKYNITLQVDCRFFFYIKKILDPLYLYIPTYTTCKMMGSQYLIISLSHMFIYFQILFHNTLHFHNYLSDDSTLTLNMYDEKKKTTWKYYPLWGVVCKACFSHTTLHVKDVFHCH